MRSTPSPRHSARCVLPMGSLGSSGNHDFYTREPDRVAQIATAGGVRILRDESHMIRRGDASLTLLGIDDTGNAVFGSSAHPTGRSTSIDPSARSSFSAIARISFLRRRIRGVDLMLSGHTHGGQVVLGRLA